MLVDFLIEYIRSSQLCSLLSVEQLFVFEDIGPISFEHVSLHDSSLILAKPRADRMYGYD